MQAKYGKESSATDYFFPMLILKTRELLARDRCNTARYCNSLLCVHGRSWFLEILIFQSSFSLGFKTVSIKIKLGVKRSRPTVRSRAFQLLGLHAVDSRRIDKGCKIGRAFSARNWTSRLYASLFIICYIPLPTPRQLSSDDYNWFEMDRSAMY